MAYSHTSVDHIPVYGKGLQKDASVQTVIFYIASSGHLFTKKKKYRVLNEKVKNIMHVYEEKTDLLFFCAMAKLS